MKYLFLYCPDTADSDATNYFNSKGYQIAPLDEKPQTFWDWVTSVDQDDIPRAPESWGRDRPIDGKGS